MIIIVACILLIWPVDAVRVSPKLDFGDSNVKSGFRSDVTGYVRDGEITKRGQTIPTRGIICTSNNCNATNIVAEKENGVSTDVLVHIKTNVDLEKTKNDTIQNVPDVPIVLGTKTSTTPAIINNRPISGLNPIFPGSSYPPISILPPLSTNNAFIPSTRPSFIQNRPLQSDSQILSYPNFVTYAPQFQDNNNNVLDFQNIYFRPPINSGSTYRPIPPTTIWNQKPVRGGGYNPVEFKKTYSNTIWSPVNSNRNNPAFNSRVGGVIPRWTPCVCEQPHLHHYPTTIGYSPSSDDPAGISGKLASFN
ncbi:hypothetical protein ILUMI_21168 [Ignelater luminosus]|uniref:Uncharacterized protein n=1 Tax=Ignelater luminosus TaxID=2038154 RepID=A0A8K0CCY2_IGNLU|nr:hypothetical protein ILUMI_21168 [Ignelater luminosus]